MRGRDERIAWMVVPCDLFHRWLTFALLAMVDGHAGIAFLHQELRHEDVPARMG